MVSETDSVLPRFFYETPPSSGQRRTNLELSPSIRHGDHSIPNHGSRSAALLARSLARPLMTTAHARHSTTIYLHFAFCLSGGYLGRVDKIVFGIACRAVLFLANFVRRGEGLAKGLSKRVVGTRWACRRVTRTHGERGVAG